MKYLIILTLFCCFCGCMGYTPDKRTIHTVSRIEHTTGSNTSVIGMYRYKIDCTSCYTGFYFYSDEVYQLGDTIKLCK